MKRTLTVIALQAGVLILPGACARPVPPIDCTPEWQQKVESDLGTGDGQGHGPDIGSDEWKSVVEFRLGVRGLPEVPERDSDSWCAYVQEKLDERHRPDE